jgi:hypothetical protein
MGLQDSGKNLMLDALGTACPYMSLHTGQPATAANELPASGSPAYARKGVTYAAAASGSKSVNGTMPVFDVPAGQTVACVGFCVSGTRGTADIKADDDVTSEAFGGQGTYTVSSAQISLT